ncbi:MAG: ABC transporter substrate-binding protein [Sandaracinaceae bacterium]|nr:ABC transporter substrate-binding protein [Sandaracinaceae bacterium]
MTQHGLRPLLTASALLLALSACRDDPSPQPVSRASHATVAEPREIELGYSALRISLPIFVAQEKGFFVARGLRVTLKRFDTAQPLVDEVLDGRIAAGGYAAFPIILNAASRDGSSMRVATSMLEDEAHPVSRLLVKRGSSIRTIADLRGKRIGRLPTVAYQHWIELVLRHAGVDPASVTLVALPPNQEVAALAESGIDALFTGDPMATAAIASDVADILDPAPVPTALVSQVRFGTFMFSNRFAEANPAEAQQLLAALDDAIALIHADPIAARSCLTPYVREYERAFVARYPDSLYVPSSIFADRDLADEVVHEHTLGILDTPPNTQGWVLLRAPGHD